jgi:hypothetical protein
LAKNSLDSDFCFFVKLSYETPTKKRFRVENRFENSRLYSLAGFLFFDGWRV